MTRPNDLLSPEQMAGIRVTFVATCMLSFISLPFIMAAIQDESERSAGPARGEH